MSEYLNHHSSRLTELIDSKAIFDYYNQLDAATRHKLNEFCRIVLEQNSKLNLTGFKTIPQLFEKFILESLTTLIVNPQFKEAKAIDIGSGAGVPGAVLAILCPNMQICSVDKSPKKIKFQNLLKTKLQLDNFSPLCVELNNYNFESKFNLCLARAFKSIEETLIVCDKLATKNAHFLFWKGEKWSIEWQNCRLKNKFHLNKAIRYNISKQSGGWLIILQRIL